MTRSAEDTFRQGFQGLAKVSRREKTSEDIPTNDPRAFGRAVAAQIFEEYVLQPVDRVSIEGEAD